MAVQRESERGYGGIVLTDEQFLVALLVSTKQAETTGNFNFGGGGSSVVVSKTTRILNMHQNIPAVDDFKLVPVMRGRIDKRCVPRIKVTCVAMAVFKGGFARNKRYMSVYFKQYKNYRKFWDDHPHLCVIASLDWDESRDGCVPSDFDGDVSSRLSYNKRCFKEAMLIAEQRNKEDGIEIAPMYTPKRFTTFQFFNSPFSVEIM
jgi:hypothetical protein